MALNITVCHKCKKADSAACGRCLLVRYCSKDCQRDDWPAHKLVCVEHTADKIADVKNIIKGLTITNYKFICLVSALAHSQTGYNLAVTVNNSSDDKIYCDVRLGELKCDLGIGHQTNDNIDIVYHVPANGDTVQITGSFAAAFGKKSYELLSKSLDVDKLGYPLRVYTDLTDECMFVLNDGMVVL